jgi:phospholipase A-2-activating protein
LLIATIGARQWINVGTVVDAVGSSGKKVDYMGKPFDYVFDVDIEDGKPPLKLPYNLSQNPYEAATKFIENNKLPISYLDQVANFITSNTQGATLGQSSEAPSAPGSDPWGSDNRYRPGGDSAPTPAASRPKGLPQKDYLDILIARVPPMHKKIQELNRSLIENNRKDISLNPTELTILSNLAKHLESVGPTKTSQSVSGGLELAIKISTAWPYADRLPGLDLLRLLAVAPMTASYTLSDGSNIVAILVSAVNEQEPAAENHVMMVVRAFGNLFQSVEGRALATSEFEQIQSLISSQLSKPSANRNLFIAITTLYINYAVYFNSSDTDASFEYVLTMINALGRIFVSQTDSEVVFRALVATGTLLFLGDEVRSAAKDVYGIEKSISKALGKAGEPRNKNVASEITDLLK